MTIGLQLKDYRLTTAEIIYRLPDHPELLQTYVWQQLDIAPLFPELTKFLQFWKREIEGKLHSIRIATGGSISPPSVRHASHMLTLH